MTERNLLNKKIDEAIQRSGYDENFIEAIKFHLSTLQKYAFAYKNIVNGKDLSDVLLSKLFLDNLDIYPNRRFASQLDENFDWDFEIFPSEVFAEEKLPEDFRKKMFFEVLKVAEVLDCRVVSVLPTEYHLQVVNKYGYPRLLADLNIIVKLPIIQSEVILLKNTLNRGDLIRVAVLIIEANNNVKVTVDENTLQFSKKYIKLGKITENDLPLYLRDKTTANKYKTLSEYLNNTPAFQNPSSFDSILTAFGLDDKRVYSFYPNLDSSTRNCPEEHTGQGLLQKAKTLDLANFLNIAASEQNHGNLDKAIDAVEVVLEYDPKCSKAYEIRGKAYAQSEKYLDFGKAFLDFEKAHQLDCNNEAAKQHMIKSLIKIATKFCSRKLYAKAIETCKTVFILDKNNPAATSFLRRLKSSARKSIVEELKTMDLGETVETPAIVMKPIENPFNVVIKHEPSHLEEQTLTALQMKKNKLVTELNQIT